MVLDAEGNEIFDEEKPEGKGQEEEPVPTPKPTPPEPTPSNTQPGNEIDLSTYLRQRIGEERIKELGIDAIKNPDVRLGMMMAEDRNTLPKKKKSATHQPNGNGPAPPTAHPIKKSGRAVNSGKGGWRNEPKKGRKIR